MSAFLEFLNGLLAEGAVRLCGRPVLQAGERARAAERLATAFAGYRLDVAGPPVPFDAEAALAAAERLGLACWFLLRRTEPPGELVKCLTLPEPPRSAAEHLSADLVLRFLPQVHRRARALAPDDVLTGWLARLLRQWPLTGVLSDVEEGPATAVELDGHPGLLLLYAERLAVNLRPAWVPRGPALGYVELVFAERGLPVPAPLPGGAGSPGTLEGCP
jgi:MoxR-vWA-beta-propeller ternary system domain bpX4